MIVVELLSQLYYGGESGIRTHGPNKGITGFQDFLA